jgi:hypothetical protein
MREGVFRTANHPRPFGLKFLSKAPKVGHPDVGVPRRIGMGLAVWERRTGRARTTQGDLNGISPQNYKTSRLPPITIKLKSQDVSIVFRRLDYILD